MSDVLVVYFSRTGTTATAARILAEQLGADLNVIGVTRPYSGRLGFLRGVWDSLRRARPRVTHAKDPGAYALVVIGSPVWAGRPAAPIRSYLTARADRIRNLAAFCVSGSGGRYESYFREVERAGGRPPVAVLPLSQTDVLQGRCGPEFESFAERLKAAIPRPARKPRMSNKAARPKSAVRTQEAIQ
jgi:flavodoxin